MNDYKKLGQSTIFNVAFYGPILLGLVLLLFTVYYNAEHSLCLSSECFNNFFTLYKLPISVMGLSIPLSAIAAAIHRSEETSRQILLTQSQFNETLAQNKFSNYIKHKEDFFDLIENMENVCKCKFNDPLGTYKKIFPKNSYSTLDFNSHPKDATQRTNKLLETLQQTLWSATTVLFDPDSSEDQYITFMVEIHDLTLQLELSCDPDAKPERSSSKLTWPDNFAETSYKNLKYIINGLVSFSSFKPSNLTAYEKSWNLQGAKNAYGVYNNNVRTINRIISEVDVDMTFG